jgi:alkylation response protein AidB-like acyl-CoA dehydrogenase
MDFELSDEQVALREAASDFFAHRWSADRVRGALDRPPVTVPDELWHEVAQLGWVGIAVPTDVGGSGGDVMTAAVLAEAAGGSLFPSALTSAVTAAVALERSGDESRRSLLIDLCEGSRRVACAFEEPGGAWGPDAVTAHASSQDGMWVVHGTKILVADADTADTFLVAARTPAGLGLVEVPADARGVTCTPMNRIDAGSIAEVALDAVAVAPGALLGGAERAEATLRATYDVATVLAAADLLGVAQAALDTTTAYAKERVQFDRPIGSFQAVSHRLADVLVDVEITRSLVYGACLALDEHQPDAAALVSAVKATANDAAVRATEAAVQLHGGIGFTWELDVHLLLRRARAGAVTFGDTAHHLDRIFGLVERARAAR